MQKYRFVNGRLEHEDFHCECGRSHVLPIHDIVVRSGALEELPVVVSHLDIGRTALVICDLNTYEAAGASAIDHLKSAGFQVRLCRFETREWVKPDEYAIGKVLLEIDGRIDFLLVVGSGCLTDLTRFVATRTGIPFVSVPTAPSMDGYASSGAPMTQDGYKRTLVCRNAQAIVADIDVMSRAPTAMIASGFADTLGKLTSRIDWKLSQIVTGEYYCDFFVDLIDSVVQRCVGDIDGLKARSPVAVATLTEGLVLSGIGMLLIGNSRPASGSEHSLSHYWEMKAALEQRPEYFHGTKVGVATAVMSSFMQKFFARDPGSIDPATLRKKKAPLADVEETLRSGLGPVASGIIEEVTRPEYLSWEAQEKQVEAISRNWREIQSLLPVVPTFERIAQIMRDLQAPFLPAQIDVDARYLRETILNAKEVRSRFTVLRAAETLGWLDEITDEVVREVATYSAS